MSDHATYTEIKKERIRKQAGRKKKVVKNRVRYYPRPEPPDTGNHTPPDTGTWGEIRKRIASKHLKPVDPATMCVCSHSKYCHPLGDDEKWGVCREVKMCGCTGYELMNLPIKN